MSESKFTEEPWNNVKKQEYYNLGLTEHYYDVYHIINAKGEIIAKLTAEGMGKDKNIKANVSLITASPDLYASEEKNLELLKIPYHAFQYMLALCKSDVKMQTFVVDQLKVKIEDIEKFAKEYEERIAETEQLLKRARGEE